MLENFYNWFGDKKIKYQHEGGHYIPTKNDDVKAYIDFINTYL